MSGVLEDITEMAQWAMKRFGEREVADNLELSDDRLRKVKDFINPRRSCILPIVVLDKDQIVAQLNLRGIVDANYRVDLMLREITDPIGIYYPISAGHLKSDEAIDLYTIICGMLKIPPEAVSIIRYTETK